MTRRQRIEDLTTFAVPEQPAVSPDGSRIAYVLRTADVEADRVVKAIWQVGTREGAARRLTRGPSDTAPAWSPDGTSIAFLRGGDAPAQLWLLPADGGEPEPLTTLPLGAGAAVWSPDGTRIAFVAPVDLRGDDAPEHEPTVVDRLDYRADGAGLYRTTRMHLHVLDVATGECRQVTEGDWHAGAPDWSPDSTRLAFAAATDPGSDLTCRAPVHVIDVTDRGARPTLVGLAEGVAGPVVWTPDGASLLVVGTAGAPVGHSSLLRLPLGGGDPVDLAGVLDRNVMAGGPANPGGTPRFAADGRTVLFCVRDRGCTHLYAVDADGGTPRPVLAGPGRVVIGLVVAGDTVATVLRTPTSLGEIVTVDLATGAETVRTSHSATGDVEWYVRAEREFTISDGTTVHGWLLRDPAAAGPQPLLLDVHGGPHGAWHGGADDWHLYQQQLVSRGWSVLVLNPRGSDGYGEAFYTAVRAAWGTADANDLLEPLDHLVAQGVADPARLAVTGYSYGGFMTCYLTSRDNRFAAAVGGGVVTDPASMAGTSDVGRYLSEYQTGGRPWEHRDRYAAQSPLARVDQVHTPTLLLHGEADLRCPVAQAEQWHAALRERGVPTRLVLYPGGSHLFPVDGPPSHRIDFNHRIVDWLERHVSGPGRPRLDAAHWQRRLAVLAARHGVPGAALGILQLGGHGDELLEAAYGVLNVDTGVEATADSVFQIGSMTKVWTTTLAMQLADEGLLDLDAPVADVLPELELADDEVTKRVTMRHLLTHTSGIDGDVFTDTGRGDDCLELYVAALREVAQNHPLGATWSYCNSGFSLAGRVIERLTGGTWDDAVRHRLVKPLGLTRTVTLPEEALLHRAAVGHLSTGRTPVWGLPRAMGPAGLISSTVADVLAFARLHLTGGLGPDGRRLVSERSVAAMTEKQADLPDRHTLGDSWGLGWVRMGWDGRRLVGHDGNTIGQAAFLRLLPEQGLAVTLLTNGGHTRDLYEELFAEIFAEVAGVAMAPPLAPPARPPAVDVRSCLGRYARSGLLIEVFEGAGGPALRTTVTGPLAELTPEPTKEYTLVPVRQDLFVVREPGMQTWTPVTFYALPTGERYVHFGVRATPEGGVNVRFELPRMLADIATLVECESPSDDAAALARSADLVAGLGARLLGAAPERLGPAHLRWRFGGPSRVLLLGHHDTVWPLGSLATRPYRVDDGILRGPGCFDMKAGLVLAFHAVAALPDRDGVTVLVTADEEIGSPTSRELIESTARGCLAALVFEGAADGGALKTERKGTSNYLVHATGRAAHAGLEPERGVNASVELAHQLLAVTALGDPGLGTTVTPTVLNAGTTTNTVPAAGQFAIDVRARHVAEQHRVDRALRALRPVLPGSRLAVSGGPNRPPLSADASADLYARTVRLAAALGLDPPGRAAVGGGSDGNFTAGLGVPTLDGLGAVGGGAHADDEHVLVAALPDRAALVNALVENLLGR